MASIYKRGKTWYSNIYFGGKQVRKPLSTDRRMAEDKLADLIKSRNSIKNYHPETNISWRDFRTKYMAHSKREKHKHTWQGEERALRNLEQVVPLQRLRQMTPAILDEVKGKWIDKKRGIYVINRDLRSLKTALHRAEVWGLMPKQNWDTKYIKTPKGRLHFFSPQDLKKLRTFCRGPFLTILYLGARAGLRRSEIYWLEWSDVDFERNRIHIAPKEGWTPKDYERRWVPMYADLREYLMNLRAKRTESWVLSDKEKRPTIESMSVYFARMVRKAHLTGSIHTLRHTFASDYVQRGGNIHKLKAYLGHGSIETTEIYSHLSPEHEDRAIDNAPKVL